MRASDKRAFRAVLEEPSFPAIMQLLRASRVADDKSSAGIPNPTLPTARDRLSLTSNRNPRSDSRGTFMLSDWPLAMNSRAARTPHGKSEGKSSAVSETASNQIRLNSWPRKESHAPSPRLTAISDYGLYRIAMQDNPVY